MNGILEIGELVATELQDDDDFTDSVYDGPQIILSSFSGFGALSTLYSPDHPNLLRFLIKMDYFRIRGIGDNIALRTFYIALKNKILNNPNLNVVHKGQVIFVDNESDPRFEGLKTSEPVIGIKDTGSSYPPMYAREREEKISVNIWIYLQQFYKSVEVTLLGA